MHKITRSLTVIGSAVALTLAGTAAASAQTSISDISSQLFPGGMPGPGGGPVTNVEQDLRNAAVDFAQKSTGKSVELRNQRARDAAPSGAWGESGVSGTRRIYSAVTGGDAYFYRVNKNEATPIINWFKANYYGYTHREYGVHVHSDADYYYVNVLFVS